MTKERDIEKNKEGFEMKESSIGKYVVKLLGGEKKLRTSIGARGFEYYEYGVFFNFDGKDVNRFGARLNGSGRFDTILYTNGRIKKIDAEIFSGELKESFKRETGLKI